MIRLIGSVGISVSLCAGKEMGALRGQVTYGGHSLIVH